MVRGRVALVTGGGRGIGRAVAARLAAAGAKLALVSRTRADLERAAAELGDACAVETCDLSDPGQIEAAHARVVARLGPIEILVNNAGIVESAPVTRLTMENWSRTLAVNLTAPFLLCKLVAPAMIQRRWGRIVNVASMAGKRGMAYITAYAASKHGLLGVTSSLADELKGTGVTVNAVCPGYVETDMTRKNVGLLSTKTGRSPEEIRRVFASSNRSGRILDPAEVAEHVMRLIEADDARTGEAIDIL
jgi:NAD(P)-dependent dehydrogenase (short-subunit alcohol dehydrogenase family)